MKYKSSILVSLGVVILISTCIYTKTNPTSLIGAATTTTKSPQYFEEILESLPMSTGKRTLIDMIKKYIKIKPLLV